MNRSAELNNVRYSGLSVGVTPRSVGRPKVLRPRVLWKGSPHFVRAAACLLWVAMAVQARDARAQPEAKTASAAKTGVARWEINDEGRLALRMVFGYAFRPQERFDLFSSRDNVRLRGAGAQVDLIRWRAPALALALDGQWWFERRKSSDLLNERIRSSYSHHNGQLGVALRYRELGWLVPHARLYGVLALTNQRLQVPGDDSVTSSTGWKPSAGAGLALGFTAHTPSLGFGQGAFPLLSLGVRLEAGAQWISGADFDPDYPRAGPQAIPVEGVSFGALPLSGTYISAALELRF